MKSYLLLQLYSLLYLLELLSESLAKMARVFQHNPLTSPLYGMSLIEKGAGEREGSGSCLPPTVESESRVEEGSVVGEELVLVLVLEAS